MQTEKRTEKSIRNVLDTFTLHTDHMLLKGQPWRGQPQSQGKQSSLTWKLILRERIRGA